MPAKRCFYAFLTPVRFLILLKHFSMPFFCRCKVSVPAKICLYSCIAAGRFLLLLKHVSICLCCDVGWLEWIRPFGVRGKRWLGRSTWLATSMTSFACGAGVVWSLCSCWVGVVTMFVIIVPSSGKGFMGFYALFIY